MSRGFNHATFDHVFCQAEQIMIVHYIFSCINSLALFRVVPAAVAAVEKLSVEQLDPDNGENDLED